MARVVTGAHVHAQWGYSSSGRVCLGDLERIPQDITCVSQSCHPTVVAAIAVSVAMSRGISRLHTAPVDRISGTVQCAACFCLP
jgi:hypothetical protein